MWINSIIHPLKTKEERLWFYKILKSSGFLIYFKNQTQTSWLTWASLKLYTFSAAVRHQRHQVAVTEGGQRSHKCSRWKSPACSTSETQMLKCKLPVAWYNCFFFKVYTTFKVIIYSWSHLPLPLKWLNEDYHIHLGVDTWTQQGPSTSIDQKLCWPVACILNDLDVILCFGLWPNYWHRQPKRRQIYFGSWFYEV